MNRSIVRILLIIIISIIVSSCLSRDAHEINRSRGELIIEANYKETQNHFPEDLDELVPHYLDSIPSTLKGSNFFYSQSPVHGFRLSYLISSKVGCGFSDRSRSWECGRGAE